MNEIKILFVDDEPQLLEQATNFLKRDDDSFDPHQADHL